jgi:hypothetical protein
VYQRLGGGAAIGERDLRNPDGSGQFDSGVPEIAHILARDGNAEAG